MPLKPFKQSKLFSAKLRRWGGRRRERGKGGKARVWAALKPLRMEEEEGGGGGNPAACLDGHFKAGRVCLGFFLAEQPKNLLQP